MLLLTLVGLLLANYDFVIQPLYAYEGLLPLGIGSDFFILAPIWIFLTAGFIPPSIRRPSDFFLFFYNITCVVWGAVLWGSTGLLSFNGALLLMVVLLIPNIFFLPLRTPLAGFASTYFPPVQLAKARRNTVPLLLLVALGGLLAYLAIGNGSFNWQQIYDRRLEARDALAGGAFATLAGYAMNTATNGAVPMVAFIAGFRRSLLLFLIAVAYMLELYWLIGQKSGFIYLITLSCIGFMLPIGAFWKRFVPLSFVAAIAIYGTSLLMFFRTGSTALADYFVRRISTVQPEIQSYYIDLFSSASWHEVLFGVGKGHYSDVTYLVGDRYLHNPASNADVNAFVYSLVSRGLIGYAVAIFIITLIYAVLDSFAEKTGRSEFFGLGALFALLIAEQAYTTVLLSSGTAICLVLLMLFSYPSARHVAMNS